MLDVAAAAVAILAGGLMGKQGSVLANSQEQVDAAEMLRERLHARLAHASYAETALTRLEDDPENPRRQAALEDALDEVVRDDPDFRRDIERQVALLSQDAPGSVSIRGQSISIGPVKGTVWGGRLPGDADEVF